MSVITARVAAARERTSWLALVAAWLLPGLMLLAPLAFLPDIGDNFDLPKLLLLRLGLAVAPLALAAGAPLDLALLRSGIVRPRWPS
jgi:hypothetical protein